MILKYNKTGKSGSLFLGLLVLTITIQAQEELVFESADLPGSVIKSEKFYTGSNLWGYMNGGADLYHEYGFKTLRYYELACNGQSLNLEIFRFGNPNQALGMFSIKKYACKNKESLLNGIFCAGDYSLILPTGSYFISISNETGSVEAMNTSMELAKSLRKKLGAKDLGESQILPSPRDGFIFRDFHIIMGTLGFQNGLPSWAAFFDGYTGYTCLHYLLEKDGIQMDALLLGFDNEEEAVRFTEEKNWTFTSNRYEQEGELNLLVERDGKVLIILIGKVPLSAMRQFQDI